MNSFSINQASVPQSVGAARLYRLRPVAPGLSLPPAVHHPEQIDAAASRTFHVNARFESNGVWAGVEQLVEAAYLSLLEGDAKDIINEHLLELHLALPGYRDRLRPQYLSLTETVGADERTRFYALDHAYRLVHGLVGVVLRWRRLAGDPGPWTVIVWNFDDAEHLSRRFFIELARRALPGREVEVIVETGSETESLPDMQIIPLLHSMRGPPWDARPAVAVADDARIKMIEQEVAGGDVAMLERMHPVLLDYYRARGDGLAVAKTAAQIFLTYNRCGYYHEARRFLPEIRNHFEKLIEGDEAKRLHYVGKMNLCLVLTGDAEAGLRIVGELAASYVTKPYVLAGLNYILGMHHLRYAQAKDIGKAEHYILQAVDDISLAGGELNPGGYAFRKVFIDNGLAFVRARQGRYQEAVELCKAGYEFLTNQMGENRHLLHRSVLQYNIAQVYVMMGRLDEGLEHYHNAIRMDPYYSEYHNEVGNILQEQQRYRAAIGHYEQAIEYSAPYPEVYFNKAVCHARLDELDDALKCFDISLELEPNHGERQALRADVLRELGRTEDALEGYYTAIALGYDSTALRVNRAVLHYNNGAYGLALSDMDHVIGLEADHGEHYENRAEIHRAMHQEDLYRGDIAMAERCREVV